jgi:glycosyltransferase involved in cell wall biosynthesis
MNAFTVGGTVRTSFTTAGALAERGHDVEVVSVTRRNDAPALEVPPGVRLRALTDLRENGIKGRGRRWAAEQPSRVISPHDFRHPRFNLLTDANLLRFLLSLRDGVVVGTRPGINLAIARLVAPGVVTVGQDHLNLKQYNPSLRGQIRSAYPRLSLVTSLTEGDAAAYRKLLGDGVRVECVPNGVPVSGRPRATPEAKVVVAAGRLSKQKGFDRLLRIWPGVVERHPDWELRIYGEGRARRKLERIIAKLGIGDSARLMGFAPRLHEEMARASVFVLSSRVEGFPMVLLEAMSVGLPIVSFNCPTGPRDVVREGIDGHVVPNGDGRALAAALSGLMADADRRRAFGAAAAEGILRYDVDTIAGRWEGLFDELAASTASRSSLPLRPALTLLGGMAAARAKRL